MSDHVHSFGNYCKNDGIISQGNYYNQFGQVISCQEKDISCPHLEPNICHHKHFAVVKDASYEDLERNLSTHISLARLQNAKASEELEDIIQSDEANKVDDMYAESVNSLSDSLELNKTQINEQEKKKKKKESHNKIEKKRISYINEKIKELGNLLPEDAKRRTFQRKGLILKEAVDHIKKLLNDQESIDILENKVERMREDIKNLLLRVQQVELHTRSDSGHLFQQKECNAHCATHR